MKIGNVNKSIVVGLVIWLSLGIGLGSAGTLTSVKVATAPAIDGAPEAIWDQATAMTVNVAGGANAGTHTVTLKSVYTGDSVYFLATWNDPTESLQRMPWVKQADGKWKQLKDPDDKGGDNNKYYEDKFAQIWNINTPTFDASGCFALCHAGEAGKPYGNKYTPNTGEMADIWHMKIVRTNPTGMWTTSIWIPCAMTRTKRQKQEGTATLEAAHTQITSMQPKRLQTIPQQPSQHRQTKPTGF
jgi:hypothetical protein